MKTKKEDRNVLKRRTKEEKGMVVVQNFKEWEKVCGGKIT
jgi:hypothetical protein